MKSIEKLFPLLFLIHLASIVFSIALAQLLYFVLLLVWAGIAFNSKKIFWNNYDLLFAFFVLLRIITIFFSEYPPASATAYLREIIFYPYYFIVMYYFRTEGFDGLRKSIAILLFAAIIPSLYAVVSVVTKTAERGASFSGGYSVFAVHASFMTAFALQLVLEEKNDARKKMILFAGLFLFTAAVLSTYTRAMWISIVLCFLFIGFIGYKKILIGLTAVGAAVVAFSSTLQERFLSLLDPLHNSSGRVELWSAGIALIPAHFFFGFGPETFGSIIGDRSRFPDPNINSWHNEFLHVCIESGIFSVILLAMLYAFPVFLIFRMKNLGHLRDGDVQFEFRFIILTMLVIIPSILFGSIMLSILNGMMLKFVLAGYSFIAEEKNILHRHTRGFLG